ncbi:sucrose-phosphate synthase [Halanaerobium saccharolyticum]|uniref:sucrose-phosphate synthase n=1 Tax=Halanaerobium saccharolyticum TaxID=43595 RepID=A0A4R7Z363_9FIRM|nr:glycosyltransferase [Halanaerobium saccharolyticum]RAK08463.1 sucrose-phosphate synthase [Halanaerobium saccharolyticum]TDW03502.1 sucrose-phosphate synthase [Halanaerobium saccharolyticum]TDX59955.1 sucrose-phosphate synthase [Halanaerobium saccharolyticum]
MSEIKHVAFLNPQGNFDQDDSYWTEHPDFGGQLVYVKEVSMALAKMGIKVDIITRQLNDPEWPEFSDLYDSYPGYDNLRIIRLPFGGDKFLAKEKLWPHLKKYVDTVAEFYDEEGAFPDFFTTHYGDGGMAGVLLKEKMETPFSFTGHSLGAQKMDKLNFSQENFEQLIDRFKFHSRIIAERLTMKFTNQIIVSTSQERMEQYSHPYYEGAVDVNNDDKFSVIPPGVNTDVFDGGYSKTTQEMIDQYLDRDLKAERTDKPAIICASRLDQKKNHLALVKAFAGDQELQQRANLIITLRGIENPFEDYSSAAGEEKEILDQIMEIIKNNGLEGKVSMFPLSSQKKLAECYGYLAERESVFSLTSFYEPFGLAPVEAMAAGLPAVVTKNGGQSEIMADDEFGILIDPEDPEDIAHGLKKIVGNNTVWKDYQIKAKERVESTYTWKQTAKRYLKAMEKGLSFDIPVIHSEIPAYYFLPDSDNEHKLLERFKEKVFRK